MADTIDKIFDHVRKVVKEFQKNALAVIEVEAVKSVRKNFESGGRPKWIPSGKKGKTKGFFGIIKPTINDPTYIVYKELEKSHIF
jgi:predicted phage gp36 major capsid-like protein